MRHSRTTTAINIDIETIEEITGCDNTTLAVGEFLQFELGRITAYSFVDGKSIKCVLDLTSQIEKLENYPAAHGGFADVWKCAWVVGSERHMVRKVNLTVKNLAY